MMKRSPPTQITFHLIVFQVSSLNWHLWQTDCAMVVLTLGAEDMSCDRLMCSSGGVFGHRLLWSLIRALNWAAFARTSVCCVSVAWLAQVVFINCLCDQLFTAALTCLNPAGTPRVGDGTPFHPVTSGGSHHRKAGSAHQTAVALCWSLNQGEWQTLSLSF